MSIFSKIWRSIGNALRYILLQAFIFLCLQVNGQIVNNDSLYSDALTRHIAYLRGIHYIGDTAYLYDTDIGYSKIPRKIDEVYVVNIKGYSLEALRKKGGMRVIELSPIRIAGKALYLVCIDFGARVGRKKLQLVRSDHSYYYYGFSGAGWEYEKCIHEDR